MSERGFPEMPIKSLKFTSDKWPKASWLPVAERYNAHSTVSAETFPTQRWKFHVNPIKIDDAGLNTAAPYFRELT